MLSLQLHRFITVTMTRFIFTHPSHPFSYQLDVCVSFFLHLSCLYIFIALLHLSLFFHLPLDYWVCPV